MTPVPDPFDKLRPQNQATWQSHGAPWCAEQMATNWPRNQYGSLLSRYEYDALLAELTRLRQDVLRIIAEEGCYCDSNALEANNDDCTGNCIASRIRKVVQ